MKKNKIKKTYVHILLYILVLILVVGYVLWVIYQEEKDIEPYIYHLQDS